MVRASGRPCTLIRTMTSIRIGRRPEDAWLSQISNRNG